MKELKFKVHSKAHEEALKQRIEELGYKLDREDNKPTMLATFKDNTYSTYGFIDFDSDPFEAATLDDLYNPDFIDGMGVEKEAEKEQTKPTIEVGKVYRNKGADCTVMCHSLDGVDDYTFTAYGFYEGNWDFDSDYDLDSTWEEVPEEDFKKMLTDKALKEYPKGTKVKCAYDGNTWKIIGHFRFDDFHSNTKFDILDERGDVIFNSETGKWAEVVERNDDKVVYGQEQLKEMNKDNDFMPKEKSAFERVGESITPEIKAEIERQVKDAIEKLKKDTWQTTGVKKTSIFGKHQIQIVNQHGHTKWIDAEKRGGMSRSEEHIDKDGNHVLKNVIFEGSITMDNGVRYSTGPEGRLCDIEMKSLTNKKGAE